MTRKRKEQLRTPEQPAVRTTIVGGRPPGCGQAVEGIPRGIEILVKKASVDPDFKKLLLDRRAEAAREIGLELAPAEVALLENVRGPQLESIIANTRVDKMTRAAFLGRAASLMLAVLVGGVASTSEAQTVGGTWPGTPSGYQPPMSFGIRPERVDPNSQQTWYVVYRKVNFKGGVSYRTADQYTYQRDVAHTARVAGLWPKAFAVAKKSWEGSAERNQVPFPVPPRNLTSCMIVTQLPGLYGSFTAEGIRAREQQAQDAIQKQKQVEEKERLARMNEEERRFEERRVQLRKVAEDLVEEKLRILSGEVVEPPSIDRPPYCKGTRPTPIGQPPRSWGHRP